MSERPTKSVVTDELLRAVFAVILDKDRGIRQHFPKACVEGAGDEVLTAFMAGFLAGVVREVGAEAIDSERAFRIVRAELEARRQDANRGKAWQRPCPGCGQPAMDGKFTCGRVECGSSTGQDRP
jgi:hypothetical protein